MEVALRRLEGVDKISISISQQKFQVTYKPGATFQPSKLRAAVAKADVKVVQFHISARGAVREIAGKRYFVAGKNKFLVVGAPEIYSEKPISVEGAVDDSADPLHLQVAQFKLVK